MPSNKEYYYHGSSQEQENDTFLNETTNLLANAGPPPPNREKSFSKIHNNLLISTIVFVGFIALVVSCFQGKLIFKIKSRREYFNNLFFSFAMKYNNSNGRRLS